MLPSSENSPDQLARGLSDKGRVRETNQDSFCVDDVANLYIVADGMGGHAGGEIASKLCITVIMKYLSENTAVFTKDTINQSDKTAMLKTLADAINHASAKIYEHALEEPSLRGMGTTATLVKIVGNSAYCAHVGDSRLYLLRSGFIYQMSTDHSLVSEQVRAGLITEDEAHLHHLKNVITRSVGYQEEEDVDTFEFELEKGDLLFLCSDGLHGKVSDNEISKLLSQHEMGSLEHLVDLANNRGGEDNISVVIVKIQDF